MTNSNQYSSGVNTMSRDETLSNLYGGNDSAPTKVNVGMRTSWTQGNLLPTPAPGPADLGGFSARTASGGPVSDTAAITGESIVSISGQEMAAEVALHLGLLVRDAKSGLLRAPEVGEGRANDADEQQHEQDHQENDQEASTLDDQGEAIMAEAFEVAPGETLSAANDIMDGGAVSTHNIEQLASRLGVEPEEVQARIDHARDEYAREAATVSARRVGVSFATATAALAHARENSLGDLKQAAEQHLHSGKPQYDHIVRDYVENLDSIDPNYILSSMGNKARWDAGSQQIVVKSRRGEMGWGAAVRAGLIKL